jgi:hypothetical protein
MSKEFLIPVRDTEDASEALARVPSFADAGDEIVVLIVSEVLGGEIVGSRPPSQVLDPLATTGGVSSEPRAAWDRPVAISSEEMMEMKGRELCEALDSKIAGLHELGYEARAEAVFNDDPGDAIRDYAGDLSVRDIYLTRAFYEDLDEETQTLVTAI